MESILYEGPNEFERISEFLQDTLQGGLVVIELRKENDMLNREIRSLQTDLEKQKAAHDAARAEIARAKLGQVSQTTFFALLRSPWVFTPSIFFVVDRCRIACQKHIKILSHARCDRSDTRAL